MNNIAIVSESGTFKGVFTQGVLDAFEEYKIEPYMIGCSSSSTVSGCFFTAGISRKMGLQYWKDVVSMRINGHSMSDITFKSIEKYSHHVKSKILKESKINLAIATSFVFNKEGAKITQGKQSKRLGKKLLISSLRRDNSWTKENLRKVIFSNNTFSNFTKITDTNFEEVLYSTSRMMHEWDVPAWIDGKPYIDASYTCSCMVDDVALIDNIDSIIVIGINPEGVYSDIFMNKKITAKDYKNVDVKFILPKYDLKEVGVDYTMASIDGIEKAYNHGYEQGISFCKNNLTKEILRNG